MEKINILETVRKEYRNYSNSFKNVANVILSHPNDVAKMSISKLASLSNVSQPTIMRFCNAVGFESFKEFKYRLTEEVTLNANYVHRGISNVGETQSYIHTVGLTTISVLDDVINQLNQSQIEAIVQLLANATEISFWGHGASAAVAMDAYHKFFRVGIPCSAHDDNHMQRMMASIAKPGNVILAISHTGRSSDLIRNVQLVRKNGGVVIAITKVGSPLAKVCSQSIAITIDEDTEIYTPMLSRLAHLVILDVLTVGVILQKGEIAISRMKKMKEGLLTIKSST